MNTIREILETPVEEAGDVLVAGAGSAGVAAAIAAARAGAKVTLVDPAGFPGGTLVSGIPIGGSFDGKRQVVRGILQEMIDRLTARGGCDDDPSRTTWVNVDVEKLKIIILEMLEEAGVHLRLHTLLVSAVVSGGKLEAAVVEGKAGRRALRTARFIDATGDADLASYAGAKVVKGRGRDGLMQPMTMMFAVANIDLKRFEVWGGYTRLEKLWTEVSSAENFRNPRRDGLSYMWGASCRVGEKAFNVTRVLHSDGADAKSLSNAEVEGRLQAWEFMEKFLRPHVAGFEKAYISWTSAKIGVRETRRIVGEYVLTRDDIWNFVKFPDAINCGSYPIDIHSPTDHTTEYPTDHFYGGKYWTIPYRCLVPVGVENLLVAGRCLSATHEALSAVRVMANTIGMGEAAGYASALSLKEGVSPRHLDPEIVRQMLLKHGGWLGELETATPDQETLLPCK
ncbi:MAG: hypothetical protein BGO12_22760 [Verrucomicrobia bacterium 61-8]|nr:FAD-dependent oxidoreductase [Verrucomicrobiota bacterium]OJV19926.1 MAG: hypothetical protein BGO12_22760 [Verrucomicrobia bacterium 61-8]